MKEPGWLEKERKDACRTACESKVPEPKLLKKKAKNVKILSLGEMLEKDAKLAKEAFTKRLIKNNPYAACLTTNFKECSFMFVDKGKKAELELLADSSLAMNFIFVGEGATLRLFTTVVSDSLNSIEVRLEGNARLDAGFLKHKGAFAYHSQAAVAGTGASVNSASFWGGSGLGDTLTELRGAESRALHVELSAAGGREDITLNSKALHAANSTESEVVMRGVAQDSSRTFFGGSVGVESNGRGSKSSLEQQVLLLDKDAKAEAEPVLEIKNNDVECSHSAAVRQIEEEKLFYLMSRGLGKDLARTTVVTGFLRSAMKRIKDKELRNMFMPPFMRD